MQEQTPVPHLDLYEDDAKYVLEYPYAYGRRYRLIVVKKIECVKDTLADFFKRPDSCNEAREIYYFFLELTSSVSICLLNIGIICIHIYLTITISLVCGSTRLATAGLPTLAALKDSLHPPLALLLHPGINSQPSQ